MLRTMLFGNAFLVSLSTEALKLRLDNPKTKEVETTVFGTDVIVKYEYNESANDWELQSLKFYDATEFEYKEWVIKSGSKKFWGYRPVDGQRETWYLEDKKIGITIGRKRPEDEKFKSKSLTDDEMLQPQSSDVQKTTDKTTATDKTGGLTNVDKTGDSLNTETNDPISEKTSSGVKNDETSANNEVVKNDRPGSTTTASTKNKRPETDGMRKGSQVTKKTEFKFADNDSKAQASDFCTVTSGVDVRIGDKDADGMSDISDLVFVKRLPDGGKEEQVVELELVIDSIKEMQIGSAKYPRGDVRLDYHEDGTITVYPKWEGDHNADTATSITFNSLEDLEDFSELEYSGVAQNSQTNLTQTNNVEPITEDSTVLESLSDALQAPGQKLDVFKCKSAVWNWLFFVALVFAVGMFVAGVYLCKKTLKQESD